jgi:hypothetical protein
MQLLPVSQSSDAFAPLACAPDDARVARHRNTAARFLEHAARSAGASFGSIHVVERITSVLVTNEILWSVSRPPSVASNGLTSADMGLFPHP